MLSLSWTINGKREVKEMLEEKVILEKTRKS